MLSMSNLVVTSWHHGYIDDGDDGNDSVVGDERFLSSLPPLLLAVVDTAIAEEASFREFFRREIDGIRVDLNESF